jgi:hypothetical protein
MDRAFLLKGSYLDSPNRISLRGMGGDLLGLMWMRAF